MALYCNVDALCEAAVVVQAVGSLLGVGRVRGEGQTQSSLGFILKCGVAMETASIVV